MKKERFIIKFAETEKELYATYRLRYKDMILEYDENSSNDQELDVSEVDKYAKQIIIIDSETDDVIGCYRMIDSNDFNEDFNAFVCESEYNIDKLKSLNERICELGRAVVKKEYRNGAPLLLLWEFIYRYIRENNIRFLIGDASFFGVDEKKYHQELSYIANNHAIDEQYEIHSLCAQKLDFIPNEEMNLAEVKNNLPPLIKAYLSFGAKISKEYFVDLEFKSVDVFILFDYQNHNERFMKRMFKL